MVSRDLMIKAEEYADVWHGENGDELGDRDSAYGAEEMDNACIAGFIAGYEMANSAKTPSEDGSPSEVDCCEASEQAKSRRTAEDREYLVREYYAGHQNACVRAKNIEEAFKIYRESHPRKANERSTSLMATPETERNSIRK